jgi:hypothetical protein
LTPVVADVMPIYDFVVNGELPQRDFNPLAYGHFVAHQSRKGRNERKKNQKKK